MRADSDLLQPRRSRHRDHDLRRLAALARSLGDKPFLDGECFTAGDLLMTTVLRILKHTDIVSR